MSPRKTAPVWTLPCPSAAFPRTRHATAALADVGRRKRSDRAWSRSQSAPPVEPGDVRPLQGVPPGFHLNLGVARGKQQPLEFLTADGRSVDRTHLGLVDRLQIGTALTEGEKDRSGSVHTPELRQRGTDLDHRKMLERRRGPHPAERAV